MAFKFVVFAACLAYASAGGLIAGPAVSYGAPALSYAAPAVSYAAPALSYAAPAAPFLGSTYHGSLAAPALSYAAPAALATPTLTSQSSNILRSFGNLGQVSTYSKTIDTPYSSVRKADIRVSNPGLRFAAAAPALAYSAPAPAIAYHAPAVGLGLRSAAIAPAVGLGVAYSAAPAVSHISYASNYANYGW